MTNLEKKYKKSQGWYSRFKRIQRIKNRLPLLNFLEVHLVDHCNLNCKGCSHYSPLSPEHFMDINKFEKNFNILSKKLRIKNIRMMGGEPLLHPDISLFIASGRKAFPKAKLSIVTNGILLPEMPQSFWDSCRDNNLIIALSKYPATEKIFSGFIDLIENNAVKVGHIHDCKKMLLFHNQKGDSEKEISYKWCQTKYPMLRNDNIFTCPKAAYIHLYNNYFGIKAKIDKGINIFPNSGKKIIEYIKKPKITCEFCTYGGKPVDWGFSSRTINEWYPEDDLNVLSKIQEFRSKKVF